WFSTVRPGEERLLAVLPFFHTFAMTVTMNMAIHCGCEIVMLPKFDLKETLATLAAKKITIFSAVPSIFTAINMHRQIDQYDLSSLHLCVSGGAPLPIEVRQKFEQRTGCTLVEGYGLTE